MCFQSRLPSAGDPMQSGRGRVGGGGVVYSKSLFPEKILLLYHSVDPTGSQTVSRVSPFLYNTALETRLTLGAVECHSAAGPSLLSFHLDKTEPLTDSEGK